ncbi:acetoacetate decarboxylase family protein [Burkholderia sp. PR2]|uniref:acetoacetate decarboxylase family protein n=1 Tax=Burkholderia sp. PR2 TaxID=3448078 RepID=UPI00402A6259
MGFVKTPDEVKEIEQLLSDGRFTTEGITVEFETTREFMRSVLAPCFELPDEPIAYANVSRWQSAMCGEFDCAIVFLRCRYKEYEGTTMLYILVSGDMPVSIGREMWGEPKKTGLAQLYVDGHQMYGYGERNGVRLIEVDGEFGPDLGPVEMEGLDFELKATPHVTGCGLQDDVVLTCMKNREAYRVRREGKASLKFNGNELDPLHTIPVVKVGKAYYSQGESSWTVPWFDVLSDRAAYVPYIYGQKYDDFRFFPTARRFRRGSGLK